jgi:hypothetical protein
MFESRFSTSTTESFAIGPARVLLDGAVRRHVVVRHTSYQNALNHKRLGNKERGHVYALYNIMFACVFGKQKKHMAQKQEDDTFLKARQWRCNSTVVRSPWKEAPVWAGAKTTLHDNTTRDQVILAMIIHITAELQVHPGAWRTSPELQVPPRNFNVSFPSLITSDKSALRIMSCCVLPRTTSVADILFLKFQNYVGLLPSTVTTFAFW